MTPDQVSRLERRLDQFLEERAGMSARIWDLAIKLAVPAVIAVGAWSIRHEVLLASQGVRLDAIEGSRFTDLDAAAMERRIVDSQPPLWLVQRLDRMEAKVDKLIHDKEK